MFFVTAVWYLVFLDFPRLKPSALWLSKWICLMFYGVMFSLEIVIGTGLVTPMKASDLVTVFAIIVSGYAGFISQICAFSTMPGFKNPYSIFGKSVAPTVIIFWNGICFGALGT